MKKTWIAIGAGLCLGCISASAPADVTVQQKTSLDVASMVRMHGATTTNITPDKKREDTESHCEGMMSLLCGNVQGGDIVRLDRDLTWHLEPDKKRYREQVFATPAELAAMRAKMEANMEKMRSCPASKQQQSVDKSPCEMSPPKIDVRKTEDRMSIAGHDTQRTSATLTESCTNKDTGDVCDTIVAFDLWLTQEKLPGSSDQHAFEQAYAKKLGLDDAQGIMRGQIARFLAPYQAQIKQLSDKSADLKGVPLKTSLRIVMGGPQCKSKTSDSSSTGSGDNPVANVAQAGKAIGAQVGSLMGGLFHKKKADDADSASAAPSATGVPDPYAAYAQLAAFSVETTAINTDAVPSTRFEVPADWTKETPKAAKGGDDEFTCPKT